MIEWRKFSDVPGMAEPWKALEAATPDTPQYAAAAAKVDTVWRAFLAAENNTTNSGEAA